MTTPGPSPTQTRVEQLLLLRAVVSFLGEKDQFGWWDTSFLGSVGQKYLSITYPRSALAAGLQATGEAARRLHDERIGKGRVFHLFRLPQALEQKIHHQRLTEGGALLPSLASRDAALKVLQGLAREPESQPDGPLRLGDAKALSGASVIGKLAGIYLGAFHGSKQTMPYFTATD